QTYYNAKNKMETIKNIIMVSALAITTGHADAQSHDAASFGREEFMPAGKNVTLHATDLGQWKPVVMIHGWPLRDAMYEYQYQYLVDKGYRVIAITLRGFGKSDKPYGAYNYDVYAQDIKTVLDKLEVEDATLGGFSMGGAISIHYVAKYNGARVGKLALFGAAAPSWTKRDGYDYGFSKEDVQGLIELSKVNRPLR